MGPLARRVAPSSACGPRHALMNSAVGEECVNTGPPYWPRRGAGDRLTETDGDSPRRRSWGLDRLNVRRGAQPCS
ncbi:unnamed protein product [Gadus morhua 'NCC']